jgi:uncharacterized protein YbjT (DUF2867 family)
MATRGEQVLVAGATGYLGGFVAEEFKSRGYSVRALARSPKKLEPIQHSLDEVVQAEITQPDTLEGVCDGIDVVFSSVGITKMAKKGRVYLIGSGDNRINPIHGADLAEVCVDAVERNLQEIDLGGPEVFTHREIARLALNAAGKQERITSVPAWVMRSLVSLTRIFNRHQGELLAFMTEAMTADAVAPAVSSRSLADYFKGLVVAE